jgi:capsular polysaccharide biosynthesis protein
MNFRLLILTCLLVLSLVGCHRNIFTGLYSATAEIQVTPRWPSAGSLGTSHIPLSEEIGFIESPDILEPTIKDLNLDHIWAKRFGKGNVLSMQDAIEHMNKMLKIEIVGGTNLVSITVSSEVAQEAADIANAVADRYKAGRDKFWNQMRAEGINSRQKMIAQWEKTVADEKAGGNKNTQDSKLQEDEQVLTALKASLKAGEAAVSPVLIISRAVAPPP